jgi:hypothetical protein
MLPVIGSANKRNHGAGKDISGREEVYWSPLT